MADHRVDDTATAGNPSSKSRNEFYYLTDEQLIHLHKCIKGEINRRCTIHQSRRAFATKLNASGEDIPDIFWKRGGKLKIKGTEPQALPYVAFGKSMQVRLKYLRALLNQDWSALWVGFDEERRYCVYAHVDPKAPIVSMSASLGGPCARPFYIGKGTLARANDMNRNQGHGIMLRQVFAAGATRSEVVHVVSDGLTEAEAFELESKLIYFFGTIYEKDRHGVLLNLDRSLRPKFGCRMAPIGTDKPSSLKPGVGLHPQSPARLASA